MKKNLIKLFVLGSVITSFLFVLFLGVNVNAEEVENTEPTTQETTTENSEALNNEEETETNVVEEIQEETNSVFEYFKSWTASDIKAWIGVLATKLGIDTLTILGLVFYFIRAKLREAKQTEFYNELITKLDAEHQKKVEDLIAEFDSKLAEVQNAVIDTLNAQDEAKRQEAEQNLDTLKAQIENIKADIEK